MAVELMYRLRKDGSEFWLTQCTNGGFEITVKSRANGGRMGPDFFYQVITEAFQEIPENICGTIKFGQMLFYRSDNELDFYKMIATQVNL